MMHSNYTQHALTIESPDGLEGAVVTGHPAIGPEETCQADSIRQHVSKTF